MKKARALMVVCAMSMCMFALTACNSEAAEEYKEEGEAEEEEEKASMEEEQAIADTDGETERNEDFEAE